MKRLILISASLVLASSAFAQSKCVSAPVQVSGEQVSITTSGAKSVTKKQTYIYYDRKHHHKNDQAYPVAAIGVKYPSEPLMMTSRKDAKAVPETYNVSLTTPQSNATICPDTTNMVNANINLEKVSSYTGNYPDYTDDKVYKQVSKREYKMAERKMRKIHRKEEKVARRAGTGVSVRSDNV